MKVIELSPLDLGLASILVLLVAALSFFQELGIGKRLLIAAMRTTVQLLLVGMVLNALFASERLLFVGLMSLVMLLVAGWEVYARQDRPLKGMWGIGVGTLSMFLSSFSVTILALIAIVGPLPWYTPRYAIPLLGMLLGNTMTGVALAMGHLSRSAWEQRGAIEERLLLGDTRQQAISGICRESLRIGLTPIINAMAAAGIVSLPGMMTGQILSGTPPSEAVKYQILIMFLITAGTGLGAMIATQLSARRLFDHRHRLRLDRLKRTA